MWHPRPKQISIGHHQGTLISGAFAGELLPNIFHLIYLQLHPVTAGLGESLWESVAEWLGWEGDLNSWIGRIQGGWETQLEVKGVIKRCHGCHVSYMNVIVCIVVKNT